MKERENFQPCLTAEIFTATIRSNRGFLPAVIHSPLRPQVSREPASTPPEHGALARSPEKVPAEEDRKNKEKVPVVICCHGLLSAKDSPKFVGMCQELAGKGLWAVRFDFTGCGGNTSAFGASLLETRLDDLQSVVGWVRSPERPWGADVALGLFGSSLGGYLSYLFAGRFPESVDAVAAWAAPARFDFIGRTQATRPPELAQVWPSALPLGAPDAGTPLPSVRNVLVLHGMDDELVPWSHAVVLYRSAAEEKLLVLMEGADHRLTEPETRARAVEITAAWMGSKLKPQS